MRSREFITEAGFIDFVKAAFTKDETLDDMPFANRVKELYRDRGMQSAAKATAQKWRSQLRAIERALQSTNVDLDETVFMRYLKDFVQDMYFRGTELERLDTMSRGFIEDAMADVYKAWSENNNKAMVKGFFDLTVRAAASRMEDMADDDKVAPKIENAIRAIFALSGQNMDAKMLRNLGDQLKKSGVTSVSKNDINTVVGKANAKGVETALRAAGISVA